MTETTPTNKHDLNEDGVIDENEGAVIFRWRRTQRYFAVVAFAAIALNTTVLIILVSMGVMTPDMINSLGAPLAWFYGVMGGVIGTFMGGEVFINRP